LLNLNILHTNIHIIML